MSGRLVSSGSAIDNTVEAETLLSAGLLTALRSDDTRPNEGLAAIADPTVTVGIETPAPDISPTMPAQQTPPVAIVSPTSPSDATARPTSEATGAAETPTVDPDATVPTGPAQPAQMGGGPAYRSLADYVNNADLIVIGSVSGPATRDEQGPQYRPLVVDRSVRGEAVEELLMYGMSDRDATVGQYLHFLRGPNDAGAGTAYAIDEIDALPAVEDEIYANDLVLLPSGVGWIAAPVELAAALEGVELLPPLTKPT
jgi:hypothetical protein